MPGVSGKEGFNSLADKDLDKFKRVTITTSDEQVYILNRKSITFPSSSTKTEADVKLIKCGKRRKLRLWLISERGKFALITSQRAVSFIEAEKK